MQRRPSLDLEDWEVDEICDPLVQNAAKVRYLRSLGIDVKRKPSGRPLVNRAHYEAVRSGNSVQRSTAAADDEPAWTVPA